jgi:hypothetical protein
MYFERIFMDEENETGVSFSLQSVESLIGSTKAFINNKGEVDVGKVMDVLISKESIQKVKIKGERTATVTMVQVFENAEDAYTAAIKLAQEHIRNLESHIAAMRGRIDNIRNNPE